MIRMIALAGIVIGGLGSVWGAMAGADLEFANDQELEQRAAELRSQGAEGVQAAVARLNELTSDPNRSEAANQMRRCVDLAAGQRDAWASRLFWYTDLASAKEAAAKSGKPILSLRMLGKLTDEFSCANSRFFRTTLYANQEIGNYLRDNFVLHWQSVRPVPRVTIDFGDGRKLERTVTGNSAHYVLDASGRPLDVLPGLYGPQAFAEWLRRSAALHSEYVAFGAQAQRDGVLVSYHTGRRAELDRRLQADLAATSPEVFNEGASLPVPATPIDAAVNQPVAAAAGGRAVSKTRVEAPIIAAIARDLDRAAKIENDVWQRISQLPGHVAGLDAASKQLMRREFPTAARAGELAGSKLKVEDPLVRLVRSFEGSISLDGVKNEYLLHRRIHVWFAAGEAPSDFDALNERVYAELFLTPSSDPWLGLAPADAYTGLDGGGLTPTGAPETQLGAVR